MRAALGGLGQFTGWDGQSIDIGDDRELDETCLPFGLLEVLQEFRAAAHMGRKRPFLAAIDGWIISDSPDPTGDRRRAQDFASRNPERRREIERDYRKRDPEKQRQLGVEKRQRQKANPESYAKRLASYRAFRARRKASRAGDE